MSNWTQGELFARARHSDPETSHAAARSLKLKDINAMEAQVLAALRRNPQGLTNHGIVEETGLSWNTATPRVHPLVQKGLVYDSGNRRMGPAGRSCVVWKATEQDEEHRHRMLSYIHDWRIRHGDT